MVKDVTRISTSIYVADDVVDSDNADLALKVLRDVEAEDLVIDDETARQLLKKIDRHMMPVLCVVYGLNFLDKTTLTYASIMGLTAPHSEGGIGLHGQQYSWLASIFYFGYLIGEWPTTRLLQYFPLGKYLAFNIIAWGSILCCFPAATSFGGALALRFLLGLLESSVTPGFALLTSQWYTATEQGLRVNLWFSFNGVAQIFGGIVAYGISKSTKTYEPAIQPWKIIFLVCGLITVFFGLFFLWIMPDNQTNARWLSPQDRLLCIQRIKANQQGIGNRQWKRCQALEAVTDPLAWSFVVYSLFSMIPNGGMTNFFSPLISSFGYTPEQALLYGAPGGAVQIVSLLLSGYLGDRYHNRLLVSSIGLLIAIIGMSLIAFLPEDMKVGRLAGFYLNQTAICPFVALLSLISTNVAGYTKKTTVASMYLIAYCVGNIIGPQTFRGSSWKPAEFTFIGCYVICFFDVLLVRWYCLRLNRAKVLNGSEEGAGGNRQWLDLTDRENPDFRYRV
ncbi:major facilitator superfamily domain-containing protein [Fusarium redolens]|uniref:Major facilitator superfamily domain-containing protein n=1 Tax=Fusarium redolens TaxID=48865 RepID=A0A9P9FYJ9_FUSRE|nr:major facilitator superfamily domain-containing protein [Fusarium redolens]KAH7216976.1 major facilitator superfamily domain-containing protein [Fusarium redolens]